jgi:bifunctional ADP-heptose synthase (sugar kinase/adenylyltransferase)
MVDPKFDNFWEYGGATIFKPNQVEWEAALFSGNNQFQEGIANIVITKGGNGMEIRRSFGGEVESIPAHKVDIADVTGAGDTVMAVLVLEYLRTNDIMRAARLANVAGALAVQVHGTAQITVEELVEAAEKWL